MMDESLTPNGVGEHHSHSLPAGQTYTQTPIAVVGMACRLPGDSNSPLALWDFLARGGVAANEPPKSRFNLHGHHDGSKKPRTMRSPGGMFLENINPQDFDAAFFGISRADAIAMDPQQRQLLEVVYEGLENAGIKLEELDGAPVGCFVGSYAVDYDYMHARDPEDRPAGTTVGVGRAILSNRISHFLNIKGPSMTIDTACSGSLVGLDLACRYLHTREISGAIIAASSIYLSPEHVTDHGTMKTANSLSGKCHTFDVKADGYVRSEAVNTVILKRLDDAIRDGDPIRAVIRGSATNSDGRTPGIASPSAEAQATAIRAAYAHAGISDFNSTSYLECHGTGTQAGDPQEVKGVASVFAPSRPANEPLIIGSIKSNIGHSEPAAGLSGLLKAIMAIEKGLIPGNPTFETPNPNIDFEGSKVRATRTMIPWPSLLLRRASINSFGYGGSNAHVVVESPKSFVQEFIESHVSSFIEEEEEDFLYGEDDTPSQRPCTLVFSANDEESLRGYIRAIDKHLSNPSVKINLRDLSYTMSERRSHHFYRGYLVSQTPEVKEESLVIGKKNTEAPRIGFVFTGQGAQWSQMGKNIVDLFPSATSLLNRLDNALQTLPNPPSWSLLSELVEPRKSEHLRLPEFSQPLVTALQLVILDILRTWNINARYTIGHSSGEIAAACAASLLTPEEAIKMAFLRGQAANNCRDQIHNRLGMLAAGLDAERVAEYLKPLGGKVQIACYNSPNSVTLSGEASELETLRESLKADGHFARLLQVDLAYHSTYMSDISKHYEDLLLQNCQRPQAGNGAVAMFSSVTGRKLDVLIDASYWRSNMESPVRFDQSLREMLSGKESADFLIEIGPSGALAGPIGQIKSALQGSNVQYCSTSHRGPDSANSLFDVAGRVFVAGGTVDLAKVNADELDSGRTKPSVVVDLPNYVWNHNTRYWHENEASKDWRFRQFPVHDLLGSKVLGTPWHAPSWKKILRVQDVSWLKDHKMGDDIVFPAAAFMAMAIEALSQTTQSLARGEGRTQNEQKRYRLRNVKFQRALVLEEGNDHKIALDLWPCSGPKSAWYEFRISSLADEIWDEHSRGLVRLENDIEEVASDAELAPLSHETSGRLWYKALNEAGYGFGPLFQKHLATESISGSLRSRSRVSLTEPPSEYPQSFYPMHPANIDACLQTVSPSLWKGRRSTVNAVLVPAIIDNMVITSKPEHPQQGISLASSAYVGVGRREDAKNYLSNASVYDPETGALLFRVEGLRYHRLDTGEVTSAAHSYCSVEWKPDVTRITQQRFLEIALNEASTDARQSGSRVDQVVDLIAHKKPKLRVLEVNMVPADTTSLWFDVSSASDAFRAVYSQYSFAALDVTTLLNLQQKYTNRRSTEFKLVDFGRSSEDFNYATKDFDVVLVKVYHRSKTVMENIIRNARLVLADMGYLIIMDNSSLSTDSDSDDAVLVNGVTTPDDDQEAVILTANNFSPVLKISDNTYPMAYLARIPQVLNSSVSPSQLDLVHLNDAESETKAIIKNALTGLGWTISEHSLPCKDLQPNRIIFVIDELSSPVLSTVADDQWEVVKRLTETGSEILWITCGSQFEVSDPEKALIHGLARTIRSEDPSVGFTTLDIESSESTAPGKETLIAIHSVLESLKLPQSNRLRENEYVQRHGIFYISRLLPDRLVNQAEKDDYEGAKPVIQNLHRSSLCVRYRSERIGTLDSLGFAEVSSREIGLGPNEIEVEIYAAGLNFKDVAVTMGIVPENEYLLGLEGAGVVRRLGKQTHSVSIGQRVLVYDKGTFANRVQTTSERVYPLPDSMSFEEAATLPSVYLVSLYGLYHMAKLAKGQTVLIHSASGGVGIAAIQLCHHAGAKVFATVGTDEKRRFLTEKFRIPPEHIFSSRSTAFAPAIMKLTNGKGVDVILNSLTGELLDESWRIIADGGNLIEIGKKDTLDRNTLAMEPFNRNASYRAVDMSHNQISDELVGRLLDELMGLIKKGYVKPITPMKIYPFEDIVSSFRYIRGGGHIGKIVISNGKEADANVEVRPAQRQLILRDDVSYLIVGGLKGLCGSLAIYLARLGAKYLTVMSRSGCDDNKSQGILNNIYAEGCQVDDVRGDVSKVEDVRRAFQKSRKPIGGIIQGAMVLRDKLFTAITSQEFHETIRSKVRGTWNLHDVALEQKRSLDFFTLLSSISGVVGNKGQANYAAANAFLDAFAHYRQRLSLPACAVDLGLIQDVGYVSERADLESSFDPEVWKPINESLLHKIFRSSLLQQAPKALNPASAPQLVTGIVIPQNEDSLLLHDARFGLLCFGTADNTSGAGSAKTDGAAKDIQALQLLLRSGAEHGIILAAAIDIVNNQFTKSLRLPEPMEPAKPLASYGLDSLAAVEFRNWARMDLGAELTTLEITGASSLVALCGKIVAKMEGAMAKKES